MLPACALLWSAPERAAAEAAATAGQGTDVPQAPAPPAWTLGARLGSAWFINSRSTALQHLFKPALRLSALTRLTPALQVGAGASAVVDSDPNYGVWGAYALGRLSSHVGSSELGLALGLGMAHDAAIVHADLDASGTLAPFYVLAAQISWPVAEDLQLGVELASEQLSVLQLGVTGAWSF